MLQVHEDNFLYENDPKFQVISGLRLYDGFTRPEFYLFGSSVVQCIELPKNNTIAACLYRRHGVQVANYGQSFESLINLYYKIPQIIGEEKPKAVFINTALPLYNNVLDIEGFPIDILNKMSRLMDSISWGDYLNCFKFLMYSLQERYPIIPFFLSTGQHKSKTAYRDINPIVMDDSCYMDSDSHLSLHGAEICADYLWKFFVERREYRNFYSFDKEKAIDTFLSCNKINTLLLNYIYDINQSIQQEKYLYKQYLTSIKTDKKSGYLGVTCDPVTFGHLNIIQWASSQVDVLYIQLMTYDNTFFSYGTRKEMLEACIPDNCIIYKRESNLINNKIKFGNYLYKTELNKIERINEKIDFEEFVVSLYEIYIEPLQIKEFFCGRETDDLVTKRLVDDKIAFFREKGLNIHIFDRINGISATKCRHLIKSKAWPDLENAIPPNVLSIIRNM